MPDRDDRLTGALGSCSIAHCGPVKLSPEEAVTRRMRWADYVREHGLEYSEPGIDGWHPETALPHKERHGDPPPLG